MVRTARIDATIVKTTLHVVYSTETVMTVDVLTPANNLHDAKDVSLVCMGLIVRTTVAYIVRTVIVTEQQALVWTAVRVDTSDVSVTKLVPLVNMAASVVKVADTVQITPLVIMLMDRVRPDAKLVIKHLLVKRPVTTENMDKIVSICVPGTALTGKRVIKLADTVHPV